MVIHVNAADLTNLKCIHEIYLSTNAQMFGINIANNILTLI